MNILLPSKMKLIHSVHLEKKSEPLNCLLQSKMIQAQKKYVQISGAADIHD